MDATRTNQTIESVNILVDPVTTEVRQAFQLVNYVFLCGIISFFGIGANIVNICVFVKQGFKDSINISLLGLAVSDLACSITMLWGSICFNPLLNELDLPISLNDVMYMSAAMPVACFNRITSFITAFITLERCLCIAMPLKVKNIITPFRTKVINVLIFVFTTMLFSPFYFVQKLEWKFSDFHNKSVIAFTFKTNREIVDAVTFFTHSVLLSSALLLTVIICTIILVVKLNNQTKWRSESSANKAAKNETISGKDKKVVKMITLIATIFIICYIPPTLNFLVMTYNTDFNFTGRLQNTIYLAWSVAFVLEAFNSSVNFFVYLKMSSKFKETLYAIFIKHVGEN